MLMGYLKAGELRGKEGATHLGGLGAMVKITGSPKHLAKKVPEVPKDNQKAIPQIRAHVSKPLVCTRTTLCLLLQEGAGGDRG